MRKREAMKKALSVLLTFSMALSWVPVTVYAVAEDGSCEHHTHDADCGYVAMVEGVDCTHQCSEACLTKEVTQCIHDHVAEGCVYTPAVEAADCDHDHSDCNYVAAQAEVPCTCGAQSQHSAECASLVTEGAECDCTTLTHAEGCNPQAAVAESCDHVHGNCAYREAAGESWSCGHVCSAETGCITFVCAHVCLEDDCGFVAAVEGSDCTFVCEECNAESEATVLTITGWSWVDEYEILSEDGTYITLPNAADWETLKSVLPAYITAMVDSAEVEIPVQWECETFPAEGEGQGTYELKAILPDGYVLGEGVAALELEVDMGVADQLATITGKCGTNATYTLTDDGVLTISGTGAIERNAFGSFANTGATENKGFTDYLKIQKVVIKEEITEVGYQAFNGCSNITSVALPSTITRIQENAFFQCTNLKSINLPEGLTYIGTNAFYQCKSLTSITLPSTLTSLGNAAFQNCTSLKTVILSEGMTATIPQYAFWGAILTDITIPASVKKLNQNAFWAASNLKNVTIKSNDITLGNPSFSASDIVFTVPCNFDNNKITASVVNNKSFTFSDDYLHIDADNDGTCDGGCGAETVASVSLNKNSITLTTAGATETLTATITPDSVTADLTWRSSNSAVATVSNGVVTAVGEGTATITVEAGGKTATCSVTVSLPENPVTGVSLSQTSLTLAVNDTYELDAIIEPENADIKSVTWSSDASNVATVDSDGVVTALAAGSATIRVTTQDGGKTATCSVTVLASHEHTWDSYTGTCGSCSLTHSTHGAYEWNNGSCSICSVVGGYCGSVGMETSVEYVLTSADNGNTYTLTISGYGRMGEYIDYNDSSNPPWYSYRTKITSVIIKNGVNDIGWGVFKYHTALQSVSIPNSVTEIKRAAFLGASSLTSITLPSTITTIGQSAFKESGLTSITIPSGVTKIQGATFSGCRKLTSVTLPNSITEIEGNAFQQCTALTSIAIPQSVMSIGEWTFNQSGLTSVTIPNFVTSLGMHAFSGCNSLKTVEISGTNLTVYERAFQGDDALETLTISNTGTVSLGDWAFGITPEEGETDKLTTITLPSNVTYTTSYAETFKNRNIPAESVSLNKSALTLYTGGSETLIATVLPEEATNKNVTWSSNAEGVATVDQTGKVTGIAEGTATITATTESGGHTATTTVTVNAKLPQTITAPTAGITVTYGYPVFALGAEGSHGELSYNVSPTDVVSIDPEGNITVLKAGSATITVTAAETEDYAENSVTVPITVNPATLTITAANMTAVVGDVKPTFTYGVTGLVGDDQLTTVPTLTCNADMKTVGEFDIVPSGAAAGDNYTINYVNGKLTVKKEYKVTVADTTNGTVTVSAAKAVEGTQIIVTATPKSSWYKLKTLVVTNAAGTSITVTNAGDGKYAFTMPTSDVTVTATFSAKVTSIADPTNPKTGDDFHLALWSGIAMTSLLGMAMMILFFPKKKGKYQR